MFGADLSAKVSSSKPGSAAQSMCEGGTHLRELALLVKETTCNSVVASCACTRQLHGGSRLIQNFSAQTTRTKSSRT